MTFDRDLRRLMLQITDELRPRGNTVEKFERITVPSVLEQKLYRLAHDGRTALTKLDGLKIRADDALFFCLDFIFVRPP